MAKRRYNKTLRVYDAAGLKKEYAGYQDRYSLYFPYPDKWVENGHVGDFLAFNFTEDETRPHITRLYWDEWHRRNGYVRLGKKVKIETLPEYVQKWIKGFEKVWNDYINNEDPFDEEIRQAWLDY